MQDPNFGKTGIRQRSNFAVQHMIAAARFSKMCGEFENENKGQPRVSFYTAETALVSATVLLTTASLESYINEVWSDGKKSLPELSDDIRKQLFELLEKKSTLEKFQSTLRIKGAPLFDKGAPPYQDTHALIELRNALVHFKPEWHDEQKHHKELEKQLKGKFEINPFAGSNDVFFPPQCMSYGCAKWAVLSAQSFVTEFSNRVHLENKYLKFLERIDPVFTPDA